MSLCLTADELEDLTGYKQPKRQMRWLAENDWLFAVGGDGLPKIDREYYRLRMGGEAVKSKRKVVRTEGLARGSKTLENA